MIITDYVHTKAGMAVFNMLNLGLSTATVGALVYFNLYDVGITTALQKLWAL